MGVPTHVSSYCIRNLLLTPLLTPYYIPVLLYDENTSHIKDKSPREMSPPNVIGTFQD